MKISSLVAPWNPENISVNIRPGSGDHGRPQQGHRQGPLQQATPQEKQEEPQDHLREDHRKNTLSRYGVSRISHKIITETTLFKNLFSEDYNSNTLRMGISSGNDFKNLFNEEAFPRTSLTDLASEIKYWVIDTRQDQQPTAQQSGIAKGPTGEH